MKKTKDLFIEQRIGEDRLELLSYEEEFIYLKNKNDVQNNERRNGIILVSDKSRNEHIGRDNGGRKVD